MPSEFAQILINSSGAVVTAAMFLWFMLKIVAQFSLFISDQSKQLQDVSEKLSELSNVISKQSEITEEQNLVIKEQKEIIQKMYEEFLRRFRTKRKL